jgi:hypothetical protein
MKTWKSNYAFVTLLGLLMVLGACAKPATSGGNYTADRDTDYSGDGGGDDDDDTGDIEMRICENELSTTSSKISEFFDVLVSGSFQGAPTYCFGADGFGSSGGDAALRVEYEDNKGIRYVTFKPDQIVSYKFSTEQAVDTDGDGDGDGYVNYFIRVIFRDDYGLVRFSASTTTRSSIDDASGDTLLSGKIRYYNLPSYEEALAAAVADRRAKCESGEWSAAKCYGFSSTKPWWEEDEELTEAQYAEKIFTENGGANTKILSNVSIDIENFNMDFLE